MKTIQAWAEKHDGGSLAADAIARGESPARVMINIIESLAWRAGQGAGSHMDDAAWRRRCYLRRSAARSGLGDFLTPYRRHQIIGS